MRKSGDMKNVRRLLWMVMVWGLAFIGVFISGLILYLHTLGE